MRDKNGVVCPVIYVKDVFRDEENQVAGIVGAFLDITERKRAEEALRRREAHLQLALEAGQLGDWHWNIATGEVTWSVRCKALYGLPPDTEITYERFLAAVHPDDRARAAAALKRAVETRSDYELEKRVVWPDGSVRWTASRGRVSCDAAGQPRNMAGVTMDITERKRTEDEIQKLNHELEKRVRERTAELAEKNEELLRMNKLFVNRELRMVELKERIRTLAAELEKRGSTST